MSERKVLNKYYPPDFDPSKIPRMKLARNRQYTVRLMAPFNMRCKTCGEYIYKGKKFNARKEDVEGDDYLGIRIYRFYIKCTRCLQEISFKTDPKNTDYEIEAGATRNFMALKLAEEQAQREEDEEKEEEATNPMKLLEKRTQQSKQELELLESLEELKDLNRRQQVIDYDQMLAQYDNEAARERALKEQEELDEAYVKSIFGKKQLVGTVVEEEVIEVTEECSEPPQKILKSSNPSESIKSSSLGSSTNSTSDITNSINPTKAIAEPTHSRSSAKSWKTKTATPSLRTSFNNLIKRKPISESHQISNNVDGKCSTVSNVTATTGSENTTNKNENPEVTNVRTDTISCDEKAKVNSLSLLCSYSGSSDDDSK